MSCSMRVYNCTPSTQYCSCLHSVLDLLFEYCCLNSVWTNTTGFTGVVSRIPYESVWPSPGSSMVQHLLIPSSYVSNDGHYATGSANAAADGDAVSADEEDGV